MIDLIAGLRDIKSLCPYMIDETIIDQHIKQARCNALTLSTNDEATTRLMSMIEPQLLFLKKDIRDKLLNECEIYCLPYPLSIAYCMVIDNRNIIVIGQGLIDLISYTIHCSHFEGTLPLCFKTFHSLCYRRDMPFSDLISNCLFLFALRFYRYAETLPDIFSLLSEEQKQDSSLAINGALVFTLLHELGHIQLGHLEDYQVRPSVTAQLINEQLDIDRQLEIEADTFAINSLIDVAHEVGQYWCSMAMSFFSSLELMSGESHEVHPLALNRRHINTGHVNTEKHFKTLADRFSKSSHAGHSFENKMFQTSKEGCFLVLQEINIAFKAIGTREKTISVVDKKM